MPADWKEKPTIEFTIFRRVIKQATIVQRLIKHKKLIFRQKIDLPDIQPDRMDTAVQIAQSRMHRPMPRNP